MKKNNTWLCIPVSVTKLKNSGLDTFAFCLCILFCNQELKEFELEKLYSMGKELVRRKHEDLSSDLHPPVKSQECQHTSVAAA